MSRFCEPYALGRGSEPYTHPHHGAVSSGCSSGYEHRLPHPVMHAKRFASEIPAAEQARHRLGAAADTIARGTIGRGGEPYSHHCAACSCLLNTMTDAGQFNREMHEVQQWNSYVQWWDEQARQRQPDIDILAAVAADAAAADAAEAAIIHGHKYAIDTLPLVPEYPELVHESTARTYAGRHTGAIAAWHTQKNSQHIVATQEIGAMDRWAECTRCEKWQLLPDDMKNPGVDDIFLCQSCDIARLRGHQKGGRRTERRIEAPEPPSGRAKCGSYTASGRLVMPTQLFSAPEYGTGRGGEDYTERTSADTVRWASDNRDMMGVGPGDKEYANMERRMRRYKK